MLFDHLERRFAPAHNRSSLVSRAAGVLSGSMPSAATSRPSRDGAAKVLSAALLFCSVFALPSAARELQISFTPNAPTWRDAVVVGVAGSGVHCTPELGEPVLSFAGYWVIDIDLLDPCTVGPPADGPFTVSTTLEPLSPRAAIVRVHDPQLPGGYVSATLTIHPGADLAITVIEPASSTTPLRFEVEGVGACPAAEVSTPAPGVVRADYDGNCPFLPPGDFRFILPFEVGPLATGDYEIQVFDRTVAPELPPVVTTRVKVWDAARCVPSGTAHCLERGRFRVEARFTDFRGRAGDGKALPTTLDDTGLFWFFSPDNVELTIKVLDGCGVNGRFWMFVSSGSTVEYEVSVTDTATGERRAYGNALGELPALVADTAAFATCP